jgi:glycosyltransferase involved in cell wall biosynthesis
MKTTVIIPAYNAGRYLGQTIDSVLGQSVSCWELIVVDDGSVDDTASLAEAYACRHSRVRVVRQENSGVAAARNRGWREVSTDTHSVIFLDADDVWEKDALAWLAKALRDNPNAVAASGLSRRIDAAGEPCDPGELETWGRRRWGVSGKRLACWPPDCPTTLGVLAYRNCIYSPGQMLVRRSAFERAGLFDPSTSPCEDWDMSLRLSLRGDIAYVDRVVLNWRLHDGNVSTQEALMTQQIFYVWRKLLSCAELTSEQRQVVTTAIRLSRCHIAAAKLRKAKFLLRQWQTREAARELRLALAGYAGAFRRGAVL